VGERCINLASPQLLEQKSDQHGPPHEAAQAGLCTINLGLNACRDDGVLPGAAGNDPR